MLVLQQTADSFDERLDLTFNWVLMLVTGGGGSYCDAMCCLKMCGDRRCVLGGSGITAQEADPMAVTPVEGNDLFRSGKKGFCCLIFDQDRVAIAAEKIFVNEEAVETAN